MKRSMESGPRYLGRELEQDVFGKAKWSREFQAALRANAKENGYMTMRDAMDIIRRHYPEDPTNPAKDFARELRIAIIEALNLSDEEADNLKFYNAINTPLDIFHGTDAWIEYADPQTHRRSQVTLDATLNTGKIAEGHKADVIITEVESVEENEEKYLSDIEKYAQEIAGILAHRVESHQRTSAAHRPSR